MTQQAKGTFTTKATPLPANEVSLGLDIGRISIQKVFRGDLEGTSVVEMLGLMPNQLKSGAYVALEKFTGSLGGRQGSFYLQHSSTMNRGVPTQSILVVPDSATDALLSLTGSMLITIVEGQHFYEFAFILPK